MSLTLPPSSTISDNMSENFSTKHSPLTQSRLQRLLQLAIPDDDGKIITKISPHHTSIKQQDTPISTYIKQQDTPTSTSIKQQDTPTSIKHQDTSTCEIYKCTPPHKDESIYQHETHQESQLSIPSSLTMPTHLRSATLPLSRSIYDDDDDDDDEYFSYPVLMTRSLRRATAPLASISAVSEAYPSRSTMLPTRTLTPAPTSTRRGSTSSFRHSRPTVPMDLFQHNTSPTVRTRSINVASRTISPVPSCPDSYTCTRRSSMSTMSMLSDTSTTSFMTFEAQSAACEREILSHECSMLSHAISKEKASQAIIDYLASQPEDPMENNDWADHVETATPQQQATNDSIDEMIRISRNLVTDSDTEDSAHELPAALRTNTALYRYAHNPNYSNSPSHVSQTIPITFTPSRKAAALMGEDVPTFDLNKSLPPSPKHTSQPSSTSPQSSSSSPSHTEPSPEQVEKKKSISIDTREEPNPATRTDMESPAGCGCCIM